jgi:hypothetical protein
MTLTALYGPGQEETRSSDLGTVELCCYTRGKGLYCMYRICITTKWP